MLFKYKLLTTIENFIFLVICFIHGCWWCLYSNNENFFILNFISNNYKIYESRFLNSFFYLDYFYDIANTNFNFVNDFIKLNKFFLQYTDILNIYIYDNIWFLTYQNANILFDLIYFLKLKQNIFLNIALIILIILLSLFLIIAILISVAFFTLFERKVMASMQRRKGPDNRISGFWGILQPLADGLKLLTKEIIIPKRATILIFIGAPMYTFLMSLMGWCVIPWSSQIIFADPKLSSLYVFAISSLGVYGILLAGWSSNSKYAFLGSLRSAAQMISYEVSLGFILIIIALFSGTYNFREIIYKQETVWYCVPLFPLMIIFFISMLAETNRAPFDLPEAEAELVSGYNTEYSSMVFAMFFLGEYSNMLLMAALIVIFFFGGWLAPFPFFFEIFDGFWFFLKIIIISFSYVWVRATLPRYRYNQLMDIGWKIFLPLTFGLLLFYTGILLYLNKGLPLLNSDLSSYFIDIFSTLNINIFLQLNEIVIF